ncbi:CmcJ/NvfI family oxidoreductase [Dyella sp.]|uniref:CmcJ/NvfI family oxidoreductase n=1 Tax=Dyella sp. TaxID=1869338 RepID=UPI002ED1A7E6
MSIKPELSAPDTAHIPSMHGAQKWFMPSPPIVQATLSYLVPGDATPIQYAYEPPAGTPWESGEFDDATMSIGDARKRDMQPSLHRDGFELWDAPTQLQNHDDDDEIRRVYYPELEELALVSTGGRHAFVFDHLVRQRQPDDQSLNFGRARRGQTAGPNARIHTDYTEASGQRRLGLVLGQDLNRHRSSRYCIVNVWRSLRGPVLDTPLAVCDARSVDAGDLIQAEVRYPRRNGEIYLATRSARHQWWYYSAMDRPEALVFKQYDSRLSGVSRFVPHAAFAHPDAPKDAPPRLSIEARCLVLLD